MLKSKTPNGFHISLPLVYDKTFRGSSREEMREEASRNEEKRSAFEALYGKDQHCPHWNPVNHIGEDITALYIFDPMDERVDLASKVKFLLHYYLFFYLRHDLLQECSAGIPESLFHPSNPSVSDHDGKSAALFREAIIYKYFDSTQEFWEQFEQAYEEVKGFVYDWPYPTPFMSLKQCHALMKEIGDSFGVKMAAMLIDACEDQERLTYIAMLGMVSRWQNGSPDQTY